MKKLTKIIVAAVLSLSIFGTGAFVGKQIQGKEHKTNEVETKVSNISKGIEYDNVTDRAVTGDSYNIFSQYFVIDTMTDSSFILRNKFNKDDVISVSVEDMKQYIEKPVIGEELTLSFNHDTLIWIEEGSFNIE